MENISVQRLTNVTVVRDGVVLFMIENFGGIPQSGMEIDMDKHYLITHVRFLPGRSVDQPNVAICEVMDLPE